MQAIESSSTSAYKPFEPNNHLITLCIKPSIVVFKPHTLTVIMVTKCTNYIIGTYVSLLQASVIKEWMEEDTQLIPSSSLPHVNVVETSCRSGQGYAQVGFTI